MHFLVETHGMERFRVLWSSRDFGRAYERPLRELEVDWRRQRLSPVRLTAMQLRRAERLYRPPAIFALPCARAQARLENAIAAAQHAAQWSRADGLYATLQGQTPGDPNLQIGRARLQLAAGHPETARRLLLDLLDAPDLGAAGRSRAARDLGEHFDIIHGRAGQKIAAD